MEGPTADKIQKGGLMVPPISRDINTFVAACETLLEGAIQPKDLTVYEKQAIQYYLSALSAKYPAVTK